MNPILPVPSTISRKLSGLLIRDPNLSGEDAAHAGDHHLHFHFVLVFGDLVEMIRSRHTLCEDHRILKKLIGPLLPGRNNVRSGELQTILERAADKARAVYTRPSCLR